MKLGKKDPELFTVVPGNPWTINGETSTARNPQDAVTEILSLAKRFPTRINVHDGDQIIALEMDKQGRTRPTSSAPEETLGEATPDTTTAMPTATAPAAAAAVPAETNETPTESDERPRRKITSLRVTGAATLILALGAGAALAFPGSGDEPEEPAAAAVEPESTHSGWKLPAGQKALAVLGNRIVTAQESTVRLLDAHTGEQAGESYEVPNPEQVRFIEGQTASAFDTGSGQVIVLHEGSVSAFDGVMNARGSEPVVVQGSDYFTADGTKHALKASQAVLAATEAAVVLIESPGKAVIGDRSVDLKAPAPEAAIIQLISATDSRVIVVWASGDHRLLTTHEVGSGEPVLKEDIGTAEVIVRSGIVWIGSDRYLDGDRIEQVCQGSHQVNATILCRASEGWESVADGSKFPDLPEAISKTFTVTAGTVTNVRTEK